jgi:hypothetical protein
MPLAAAGILLKHKRAFFPKAISPPPPLFLSPSYLLKSASICGQKTKSQVAKNRCGNGRAFMLRCPTIQNIHAIRSHAAPSKGCVPLFENLATIASALGITQPSANAQTARKRIPSMCVALPTPVRNIAHSARSRIQNSPSFVPRRTLRHCISRNFRAARVPEPGTGKPACGICSAHFHR